MKFDAVLWDYDGTLVNSAPKNISITIDILKKIVPHLTEENLPKYLLNEQLYHKANHEAENWLDLYINYLGMTEEEAIKAGKLWSVHQKSNSTPVELFENISEVVSQLSLPQGICSQNSNKNIENLLKSHHISQFFNSIIGYDDVETNAQKPSAEGGIKCLHQIFGKLNDLKILYIGDHKSDILFANNIREKLVPQHSTAYSAIVTYSGANIENWDIQPDFVIHNPLDLLEVVK